MIKSRFVFKIINTKVIPTVSDAGIRRTAALTQPRSKFRTWCAVSEPLSLTQRCPPVPSSSARHTPMSEGAVRTISLGKYEQSFTTQSKSSLTKGAGACTCCFNVGEYLPRKVGCLSSFTSQGLPVLPLWPLSMDTTSATGVRAFSTCSTCFSPEKRKPSVGFSMTTGSQSNIGRSVGRSIRNHGESKFVFSASKFTRVQDRARQNIKGRVSRLKARMIYHNRYLQEKLSAQRIRGSIAVGKLRKKLQVKKENIKTIPNLLTTLRMTSAPVLAYLVVNDHFSLALSVFLVAGLTDMLDGYIARNFKNQRTALGTALDPLADKLLISFLTVSLTSADLIPLPMTALILSRDAGLILASFYIRYISLAPPRTLSRYFDVSHVTAKLYPSTISKVNTTLQLLYVACTLASPVFDCVGHPFFQGLMYVTATTTFLSGADYVMTWRRRLKIIKNK